jgi:mersacidin/lichenicidin family type 2 lantibiotic
MQNDEENGTPTIPTLKRKETSMKQTDVIRAWKDRDYRESLSEEERATLPEHPTGIAELDDAALQSIAGGCILTTLATSCVPPGVQCP